MLSDTNYFTKVNFDTYLKELAKEFRKLNGKTMKAEIILVGGAAVLANYGFRNMTTDIDAIIHASSAMRDAINKVRDIYDLPQGWLNADFVRTNSYTPKLNQYSVYYRTYSNVLTIRTITAEYLIAMKLRSGRKYKNDLSDIIGILNEHERQGQPISFEMVEMAVVNLYGGWSGFTEEAQSFIKETIDRGEYDKAFRATREEEQKNKIALVKFEKEYPDVLNGDNLQNIIESLKARRNNNELVDK